MGIKEPTIPTDLAVRLHKLEKELSPDSYNSIDSWANILETTSLRPIIHWLDETGLNLFDEIISTKMQEESMVPAGVDSDFDETIKDYLAGKYSNTQSDNNNANEDNKRYWPSAIIQDDGEVKPWLYSMTSSQSNLDDAKLVIEQLRKNHNVLSAWIDAFDENGMKTIAFHECYI